MRTAGESEGADMGGSGSFEGYAGDKEMGVFVGFGEGLRARWVSYLGGCFALDVVWYLGARGVDGGRLGTAAPTLMRRCGWGERWTERRFFGASC